MPDAIASRASAKHASAKLALARDFASRRMPRWQPRYRRATPRRPVVLRRRLSAALPCQLGTARARGGRLTPCQWQQSCHPRKVPRIKKLAIHDNGEPSAATDSARCRAHPSLSANSDGPWRKETRRIG